MIGFIVHKALCAVHGIDSKTMKPKEKKSNGFTEMPFSEKKIVYTDKNDACRMVLDSPNASREQKQKANEFLGLMKK